jgi:hypothetical protein
MGIVNQKLYFLLVPFELGFMIHLHIFKFELMYTFCITPVYLCSHVLVEF